MDMAPHLLSAMRREHGVDGLELEWRLGSFSETNAHFRPGVPHDTWRRISSYLDAVYPFDDIQTNEYCTPSGAKLVMSPNDAAAPIWITKQKLAALDDAHTLPHVRLSLNRESIEPATPNEPVPQNTFARFKRRRRYRVDDTWFIDMTRVATNQDIDCDVVFHEMEVELADPDLLFVRPVDYILHAGRHLVQSIVRRAGVHGA